MRGSDLWRYLLGKSRHRGKGTVSCVVYSFLEELWHLYVPTMLTNGESLMRRRSQTGSGGGANLLDIALEHLTLPDAGNNDLALAAKGACPRCPRVLAFLTYETLCLQNKWPLRAVY